MHVPVMSIPDPVLFPAFADARWATVDLDAEAAAAFPPDIPNPALDPDVCEAFVRDVARRHGCDVTMGGYLEDRARLWRGHYHAPGMTRHLGIDYNVPAGTAVTSPADCFVERVERDPDQGGGWGGVAIVRLALPHRGATHAMLAHMAHASLPATGARLRRGEALGTVGVPTENGGWFPHLHVQLVDAHGRDFPALGDIDGYGPVDEVARPDMPDPSAFAAGLPG